MMQGKTSSRKPGPLTGFTPLEISEEKFEKIFLLGTEKKFKQKEHSGVLLGHSAKPQFQTGFTIIEIMIVITAITLASAAVLIGLQSASRGQSLQRSAAALAVDIRSVQNRALSATPESGAVPPGGYGVYFGDPNGKTYQIFADSNGNHIYDGPAELLEEGLLGKYARFGGFNVSASVAGDPPVSASELTMLFCPPYAVTLVYDETSLPMQRGSSCTGDQSTLRRYATLMLTQVGGSGGGEGVRNVRVYASGAVALLDDAQAVVAAMFPPAPGFFVLPPPPPPADLAPGSASAKVNFQPLSTMEPLPVGYVKDTGAIFNPSCVPSPTTLCYGWDVSPSMFDCMRPPDCSSLDVRYETLATMQLGSSWKLKIPTPGLYRIFMVAGHPTNFGLPIDIYVEGNPFLSGTTSDQTRWVQTTATVTISGGELTVSSPSASSWINFIEVKSLAPPPPPSINTGYQLSDTSPPTKTCTAPGGGSWATDNVPPASINDLAQCDSDSSPVIQQAVVLDGFSLSAASGAINGIVVHINDVSLSVIPANGNQNLQIRLSWNGGTSWTGYCTTNDITNALLDGAEYYCSDATTAGTTDPSSGTLWGRPWTAGELSAVNFRVEVRATNNNATLRTQRFDVARVKVYYTP